MEEIQNTQDNQVVEEQHFNPIKQESYFDGTLGQMICWRLLTTFVTIITFGLATPWAICKMYAWETKHTVINGHRLKFTGTGMQLFGNWIKWILLTIITLGIYSFWLSIKLKKWQTKHTEFAD